MLKLTTDQIQQLVLDTIPGDCLHKDGTFRAYNPYVDGAWSKTLWFCVACDADIGNQSLPSNQYLDKHKPGCRAIEQRAKMYHAINRLEQHAVDIATAYLHTVYELERIQKLHTQELAKRDADLESYVATVMELSIQNKSLGAEIIRLDKENTLLRQQKENL